MSSRGGVAKQTLDLSHQGLDDAGLLKLVEEGALHHQVGILLLAGNKLTAKGLAYLLQSQINGLHHLDLSGNPIGDQGLKFLAAHPKYGHVTTLHLNNTNITQAGLRHYLDSFSSRAPLTTLAVSHNPLGDGVVEVITGNKHLQWMNLHLTDVQLTDKGVAPLLKGPALEWLMSITLDGNSLSPSMKVKLRNSDRLPLAEVILETTQE